MKFGVNEAVDFQTEHQIKTRINERILGIYKNAGEWYEPHDLNNNMLTTRVIV